MEQQTPDEPSWRRRAIEIEYWLATAFVIGAFVVGIWAAIKSL